MKKLLLCITAMFLLAGTLIACGNENNSVAGTYTITVAAENGKAMEGVQVRVYADTSKDDIVAVGKTDENGRVSFESDGAVGAVIYLEDIPLGYNLAEYYEIAKLDTEINLKTELIPETELEGVTFELGSVFADMSVNTPEGKTYTISEILKEKKAVVINFWFLNCAPCKMEFPFLQQAYADYQDELEVLAVNLVDGTNKNIAEFQKEQGLTFPMAVCDVAWAEYLELNAYPTTVIIDRYGTIGMIHKGMITDKETFTKVFEFFTADDYEQTTIEKLSDIE